MSVSITSITSTLIKSITSPVTTKLIIFKVVLTVFNMHSKSFVTLSLRGS